MNVLRAARLPALLLAGALMGLATGNAPNGHVEPHRCYDPANPDPASGGGVFEGTLLGTTVHLVLARGSVFETADINCRESDPRL